MNDPTPPCEREWTPEEQEEFYASVGLSGTATNTPFRPSAWISNCGDEIAKHWYPAGIFVTSIVPPAQGWPIAMYCPICKVTTFVLSPYALKPEKGDYWLIKDTCGSDVLGDMHGIEMALDRTHMELLRYPISPKSIFGYDPLGVTK